MAEKSSCDHDNCVLTREHLLYLSERTVKEWRRVLSFLHVKQSIIDNVEEDAFIKNYDSREIAYQGYIKWNQSMPKEATICSIISALKFVDRNDIVQDFQDKFYIPDFTHSRRGARSSVKYFVGRLAEMEQIQQFCDFDNKSKLMCINGSVGVGKAELLLNALNHVAITKPSLNIVKPVFPSAGDELKWGFEDLAMRILDELKPGISVTKHRVAFFHKTLINIVVPTILVLEMAYINFKENALLSFWYFISCILRVDNVDLKIIISSCKCPDLLQMQNLEKEKIALKDFEEDEVSELLQRMNPGLNDEECKEIFKFCGGNPFILRKLGVHIQNFSQPQRDLKELLSMLKCNSQFDLKPFFRQTVLRKNMKIVFDELDLEERETLVKLSCFNNVIPVETLNYLFGRDVKNVTHHLYQHHSVVEQRRSGVGTFYFINEITRLFVQEYSKSNSSFSYLLEKTRSELIIHHLDLIRQLDDLYFSPSSLDKYQLCKYLVEDYQKTCKLCACKSGCQCLLPQIIEFLFRKHKAMIVQAVSLGLNYEDSSIYLKTVDTCHRAVHFLRATMPYDELQDLYDHIFEHLNTKDDAIRMVITMANIVFIKGYRFVFCEKEQNIHYLTKAISVLETNRSSLSVDMFLCLVYCYGIRGFLLGYYCYQLDEGEDDIEKGRKVLSSLRPNSRSRLIEYFLDGQIASIYVRHAIYSKAVLQRENQVSGFRKLLGTHKHTAKSLYYLGKAYVKMGQLEKARNCLLVSYQINLKLNERFAENLCVLSTYGKVWIKSGRVQYGMQLLKQAVDAGENELGDHDIVARCYEQLADAKSTQNGSSIEVHELKERAKNIRNSFEMKSSFTARRTYSLHSHAEEEEAEMCISARIHWRNRCMRKRFMIFLPLVLLWHVFLYFVFLYNK